MAGRKIGERVGALLSANVKAVKLLGYGVYVGDEVPPNEGPHSLTGLMAEIGNTNPKIVLDNDDVIWGCECWWGPESEVQAQVQSFVERGAELETVRIGDARGSADEASN